jgi:hypothetical protein
VQGDEYLLALKREPHKVKQLNKRSWLSVCFKNRAGLTWTLSGLIVQFNLDLWKWNHVVTSDCW